MRRLLGDLGLVWCALVAASASCMRWGFERVDLRQATDEQADTGDGAGDVDDSDADETSGDTLPQSSAWRDLGGSASAGGVSGSSSPVTCLRVAVDRAGVPYVAWTDAHTGAWEIYLRLFDGQAWVSLGGSGDDGGLSRAQSTPPGPRDSMCLGGIAFDSGGRPNIAWMDYRDGRQDTFFARWSGVSWEALDGSAAAGGISKNGTAWWPTVTVDGLDRPVVAWESAAGLAIRRWNGTTWEALEAAADSLGPAQARGAWPQLERGEGEDLFLAWQVGGSAAPELRASQWSGAAWHTLRGGAGDASLSEVAGPARLAAVAARNGVGLAVFGVSAASATSEQPLIWLWNGQEWRELATSFGLLALAPELTAFTGTLAPDGNPIAVWSQAQQGVHSIDCARFDGTAWALVGEADSIPGRVYATAELAEWPHIAVGPAGEAYVIFETIADGTRQAYLRALIAPGH